MPVKLINVFHVEAEPVRVTADQVFTNAIVDAVAPTMLNR